MPRVTVPWGDSETSFDLPPSWRIAATLEPPGLDPAGDPAHAVEEAVARPIGAPPLAELCRAARRVVLVVDDSSRPTPAHALLPPLLDAIERGGHDLSRLPIVFATGTHRPMTDSEAARKVGGDVAARCVLEMHDARAPDLVREGVTARGTPASFNRRVDDADLRILVGSLDGHPQAGFGGGYKLLFPGCAGAEGVAKNHLLVPSPSRYNLTAMPPDRNPMRSDLEEACRLLAGRTFIVNAIATPQGRVGRVVAGDPIEAHRAGIEILLRAKSVRIERPFDVVLASSSPMDLDVRQGGKAITSAALACRPGGLVLAALRAKEGLGRDAPPRSFRMPSARVSRAALRLLGARGIHAVSSLLRSVPPEERHFVNVALQLYREFKLLCYSPTICEQTAGRLAPVFFDDPRRFVEAAVRWAGPGPRAVGVFPKGAGMIVRTA